MYIRVTRPSRFFPGGHACQTKQDQWCLVSLARLLSPSLSLSSTHTLTCTHAQKEGRKKERRGGKESGVNRKAFLSHMTVDVLTNCHMKFFSVNLARYFNVKRLHHSKC